MASRARDPLKTVLSAVQLVDPLGFVMGLLRALERKHIGCRRDDRVWLGREQLHVIAEVQTLFDEVRDALLGLLHAGG